MNPLLPVRSPADILPAYRETPVGDFLAYHNLGAPHRSYRQAELLVGMCMDHRKVLRIPDNFAYILRSGGANLRRIEFKVSYAVAVGGVRTICLLGHDKCGMVDLTARRGEFVTGLVENGGWDASAAAQHFDHWAPVFEIDDAAEFALSEARRLRGRYPKVIIAPLMYDLGDGLLYQVPEE